MRKTALVTGGTRGIGLGIATALAREGYDLAICGLREANAVAPVLAALKTQGVDAVYFQADLARRDARFRLLQGTQQRFGRLNLLVNNAGIAPPERKDLLEAGEDAFEFVVRTNLQGPYFLTQAVARWMIEQRQSDPAYEGAIVFVTSGSPAAASVSRGEYGVSKAGLSAAAALFAARLAEFGIPVFEVRPGITGTALTPDAKEPEDRRSAVGLPLRHGGDTADDVGRAVVLRICRDPGGASGRQTGIAGGLTIERLQENGDVQHLR